MKKRYVFFIPTLRQGGGERVISLLSRKMTEEDLSVTILLYLDEPIFYEIDPRVNIVCVRRETGSSNMMKNLFWMRRFLRENADVLISFLAPYNILALLATLGGKQTVIVADRNDPRFIPAKPMIRKIRDFLYRFAHGVIVQTTHNLEYFSPCIQKKSRVIFNPVDMKDLAGKALTAEKEKVIVSVGRLLPQKNQELLVKAFAKVHTAFPEHKLVIYGDGAHRDPLEALIQKLDLQQHVLLPGTFKNVHEKILTAELFVMSSNFEGMPNALIEAMCLGLPVISTKVSGATDLIRNGENGLLVDVGDEEALAEAMKTLLQDENLRKTFGQRATELNDMLKIEDITRQWLDAVDLYAGS